MRRQLQLAIVVASTPSGGIGNEGGLPWPTLDEDMRSFYKLTTTVGQPGRAILGRTPPPLEVPEIPTDELLRFNAVMCGRRTWESLPKRSRPLTRRLNIIVSKTLYDARCCDADVPQTDETQQVLRLYDCDAHKALPPHQQLSSPLVFKTFLEAVEFLRHQTYMDVDRCFVIGGARMYDECIHHPSCQRIYWTRVLKEFPHDTKLSQYFIQRSNEAFLWRDKGWEYSQHGVSYYINQYDRRNQQEGQYLKMASKIMTLGDARKDRTGVGTVAAFGKRLRFDLSLGFPLLTSKRVFFRGVLEELLWMIRGSTDSKELSSAGVKIWDENGSREFLDSRGLHERREGDLGPVYGFQWRHFGAKYVDCDTYYAGQGVDQLQQMIHIIKTNPTDRRILMSAWNPEDLDQMALPPCHLLCQMFVNVSKQTLSCSVYQRSCDLGLGVPFNIASYALLTHMVAHVCGLGVGELVMNMGDTHVYLNHLDAMHEITERSPRPFPMLRILRSVQDIDEFVADDFRVEHYDPHASVEMAMAV